AVDQHNIEHLGARIHLHTAGFDLFRESLISAQEQLLTGLATRIKRSRHLRAAERTVRQVARVLARKRNALSDTLIDDVDAHFSQPVDVRFTRAKVPALDRVVDQPIDAIAVVLIILRGVDSTLRGDRMRAARAVLKAEAFDSVTQLRKRRRCRSACEPRAYNDYVELALVGR